MEVQSTTQIKVQKFIMSYGAETLISWLDHFDRIITSKDYPVYRTLEKQACKACDITISDMKLTSNTESTNAKRIITFISFHQIKLSVSSISKLLNVSDRTVNYYIKEAESWINAPKTNKVFVEAYNRVIENLKIS